MTKPGFIVEGEMEKLFVEATCPGRPVRKIGCNGDDVKISEIARRVGTHARMLQKKCDLMIVVFDRESRCKCATDIESEFLCELQKENINCAVVVGIPDRHIECWILSDWEGFCKVSGAPVDPKIEAEGKRGKPLLKSLLPKNTKYLETLEGVGWLKKMDAKKISENSASFERFTKQLEDLDCWWLHRERLESKN